MLFKQASTRNGTSGLLTEQTFSITNNLITDADLRDKLSDTFLLNGVAGGPGLENGATHRRATYPRIPYLGILASMNIEATASSASSRSMESAHLLLQKCISTSGSIYTLGTCSAVENMFDSSSAIQPTSSSLFYAKYVDGFCDAFTKLDSMTRCVATQQKSIYHGEDCGQKEAHTLHWVCGRHPKYKDTTAMFFAEDGKLCCFVHTTSSATRQHLDLWFSKVMDLDQHAQKKDKGDAAERAKVDEDDRALNWVDGATFVMDDPPASSSASAVSRVRVIFDLLLNLRLHTAASAPVISPLDDSAGPNPTSSVQTPLLMQSEQGGLVPSGIHLCVVASYDFAMSEHRLPHLRAVKRFQRGAPAGDDEGGEKPAALPNVYCWTVVASPGYHLLPAALHAVVHCLRRSCRLQQFTIRMSARTKQNATQGATKTAVAPPADPQRGGGRDGLEMIQTGSGRGGPLSLLSTVYNPMLVFSRLSSMDWMSPGQRRLYSSARPAGPLPLDGDVEEDLECEFYPSTISFQAGEAVHAKRSRSPTPQRQTSSTTAWPPVAVSGDEFQFTNVVVYVSGTQQGVAVSEDNDT